MGPLHYAAKFDPFLSLDCAQPGTIQGKEAIKFSHLATLYGCPLICLVRGLTCDRLLIRLFCFTGLLMLFRRVFDAQLLPQAVD